MWMYRSHQESGRPASRTSTRVEGLAGGRRAGSEAGNTGRGIGGGAFRERAAGGAAADDHEVVRHERTTVCSSVNDSIGAVPPTRPMPLAVPERPPNGRCPS